LGDFRVKGPHGTDCRGNSSLEIARQVVRQLLGQAAGNIEGQNGVDPIGLEVPATGIRGGEVREKEAQSHGERDAKPQAAARSAVVWWVGHHW
jgi:hypothetical protein